MKRAPIKTKSGTLPPPIPAHFADEENHATETPRPAPRRRALDAPLLAKNSCANWSPVIPALEDASPQRTH